MDAIRIATGEIVEATPITHAWFHEERPNPVILSGTSVDLQHSTVWVNDNDKDFGQEGDWIITEHDGKRSICSIEAFNKLYTGMV